MKALLPLLLLFLSLPGCGPSKRPPVIDLKLVGATTAQEVKLRAAVAHITSGWVADHGAIRWWTPVTVYADRAVIHCGDVYPARGCSYVEGRVWRIAVPAATDWRCAVLYHELCHVFILPRDSTHSDPRWLTIWRERSTHLANQLGLGGPP